MRGWLLIFAEGYPGTKVAVQRGRVASVPHRLSPSSRWSRISRNTRVAAHPMAMLSQAHPAPCGGPRHGTAWAASTARIAATSVSSDARRLRPRLALGGPWGDAVRAAVSYTVERGTR